MTRVLWVEHGEPLQGALHALRLVAPEEELPALGAEGQTQLRHQARARLSAADGVCSQRLSVAPFFEVPPVLFSRFQRQTGRTVCPLN